VNLARSCKHLKLIQTNNAQLLQEMGRVYEGVKIEYIEPINSW